MPEPDPIKHVELNIKLSSKINEIIEIQRFYRNFIKSTN